jgi:uncharacterized protein
MIPSDKFGRTPLHDAAAQGQAERVRQLIAAGALVDAQDHDGWTALHFAAQAQSEIVVQLLLTAGARIDVPDSHGNNALFRAVFSSRGDGTVIEMLLKAGADPYAKNKHDVSAFDLAQRIANYDLARFFQHLPPPQ